MSTLDLQNIFTLNHGLRAELSQAAAKTIWDNLSDALRIEFEQRKADRESYDLTYALLPKLKEQTVKTRDAVHYNKTIENMLALLAGQEKRLESKQAERLSKEGAEKFLGSGEAAVAHHAKELQGTLKSLHGLISKSDYLKGIIGQEHFDVLQSFIAAPQDDVDALEDWISDVQKNIRSTTPPITFEEEIANGMSALVQTPRFIQGPERIVERIVEVPAPRQTWRQWIFGG